MSPRAFRLWAALLLLAVFGAGLATFVLGWNDESAAARAADAALVLIDLACATALSFLIWPRRA